MLKTSYELSLERIIAPNYKETIEENIEEPVYNTIEEYQDAQETKENTKRDFVYIGEFSDRGDKVLESNETKLIEDPEKEREKNNTMQNDSVKIQNSESINYDDILEVHFCGSTKSFSGYSKMNRNIIFGLSNRNVKVKVEDMSDSVDINEETQKHIHFLENLDISNKAPKIYSMTVPSSVTHSGKKIAYTMMESSSLHKDYCEKLNLMDELWVPSVYGKKLMQKSNIHPPIFVMPLGVDTERYKPNCGTINFGSATRSFKFLCVAKYSARKGFDILLKAFMEEFNGNEDVSLVLVTSPLNTMAEMAGKEKGQVIIDDFNEIRSSVKKSDEDLPHIALYMKPVAEKDMPKIYSSCNAFVCVSRGEGFSLPPLEASSCGLPVIASNVTAHTDFLKEDNSYLIEPDGFREVKCGGNMSRMAKLCHFYEGQFFPDFSETGVAQTRNQMRHVYENYSEAQEKNKKLQQSIAKNYTWDMSIDRVYSRLMEV